MNDTVGDMNWQTIPEKERVEKVITALSSNGISAELVATKKDAKKRVLDLLPKKAEVMLMTSVTLTESGVVDAITSSEDYVDLKKKLSSMDRETKNREMQEIGAAPEWAIGSVHAVTEGGEVLIASNTGSQLAAYVYGADHVIFVVGVQKIVENLDEGMKRIYEYVLPLESVRARKAYNLPNDWNSNVSKVLIINKEVKPDRIHLILINDLIGF